MYKVIDCAWNIGDHAAAIKAAGVETVIRYYNHNNSSTFPSKRLEAAEADALAEAGLSLAVVFQQRGGHNGHIEDLDAESGKRDAARALELADRIKQPEGSAIYFAIDHDYYTSSDLKRIKPYFAEVAKALKGTYKVGLYGSGTQARIMRDAGYVDLIWLAAATGWSGTKDMLQTDAWALYQIYPSKSWPGGAFSYDGNVVSGAWSDFGQFRPGVALDEAELLALSTGIKSSSSVLMEVTARGGLNLRRGPSTDYGMETSLPLGVILHALGRNGAWLQVDVEGDGVADGFMHGDFLRAVSGGLPLPAEAGATAYSVARQELALDVREYPGAANNPRIVMYHKSTKPWSGTDDSVPWCSSFVNYCVEQAGGQGTYSQSALSWKDWGQDVSDNPREGDIAVFKRTGGGHVAFFVADQGDRVSVLGGNQSNRVCIASYPKKSGGYELVSIRRG